MKITEPFVLFSGLRFAMLEMKLGLTEFLLLYKVNMSSSTPKNLEMDPGSFILAPKNGIHLLVEKRHIETRA